MLIDVSYNLTKTLKVRRVVEGPYRVLRQDQHTFFIHREELNEWIIAYRVAIAGQPAGVPPNPTESASAIDIQDRSIAGTSLMLDEILDRYFNDDV